MELFIINYGLGGGFGGANNYEVVQTVNLEDAEKWAFESACEDYEGYAGMYGLRDESQIMEEDECDEEDARYTFEEERESWIIVLYHTVEKKKYTTDNRYTELCSIKPNLKVYD
jgi:hypothetical protein